MTKPHRWPWLCLYTLGQSRTVPGRGYYFCVNKIPFKLYLREKKKERQRERERVSIFFIYKREVPYKIRGRQAKVMVIKYMFVNSYINHRNRRTVLFVVSYFIFTLVFCK